MPRFQDLFSFSLDDFGDIHWTVSADFPWTFIPYYHYSIPRSHEQLIRSVDTYLLSAVDSSSKFVSQELRLRSRS